MLNSKPISPFRLVIDLIGTEFIPVSMDLLKRIDAIYVTNGLQLPSYADVFNTLVYLKRHNVLELLPLKNGEILVKSIYGKNN